jgi:hypothetical protein
VRLSRAFATTGDPAPVNGGVGLIRILERTSDPEAGR